MSNIRSPGLPGNTPRPIGVLAAQTIASAILAPVWADGELLDVVAFGKTREDLKLVSEVFP